MKNIQPTVDKAAMSLSLLCAAHCLALPFLVTLLPVVAALNFDDDTFHLWLLLGVIPTSVIALTIGCRKHKNVNIILLGVLGVGVLMVAALPGYATLGEWGERVVTVIGATIIAIAHFFNHRLCRRANCECHS